MFIQTNSFTTKLKLIISFVMMKNSYFRPLFIKLIFVSLMAQGIKDFSLSVIIPVNLTIFKKHYFVKAIIQWMIN